MKETAAKSAMRAFTILELFRARQTPLALKDVVEALTLPNSSADELLKSMAHGGYLCFDPVTRRYLPTPRVTSLGCWIPDALLMHGKIRESAVRLSELTGELVAIGTANELFMQDVELIPAANPISYDASRSVTPLVNSAKGLSWLSEEDEPRIERIYRQSVSRGLVDRRALPLNRLLCRIEAVRGREVAVIDSACHAGATLLAVNVPVPQAKRRLVLSVGGARSRIRANLDRYKHALAAERRALLEVVGKPEPFRHGGSGATLSPRGARLP